MTTTPHSVSGALPMQVERLREAARLAFAVEVSAIEPDTRLRDLTADETDSIVDGILAASRLYPTPSLQPDGEGVRYARERLAKMADHGRIDSAYRDFSHPAATMIADVRKLLAALAKPEGETVTDDGVGQADAEVERILSLSDDQVLAEASPEDLAWARLFKARMIAIKHALPGRYDGVSTHAAIRGDADNAPYMLAIQEALAASPKPTTVEASGMVERRGEMRAVARIVNVARAIGAQAGVGGRETAGAIVSYLATSPDEIGPFMDGKLSPLDFKGDWMRGGCLSWHAANGKVVHPEDLAAQEEKA